MRSCPASFSSLALNKAGFFALAVFALLPFSGFAQSPVPENKPAAYPAWWFELDVIKRINPANPSHSWPEDYPLSDDFAIINQGQLKHLAKLARLELEGQLHGEGAGDALDTLVAGWTTPSADDYVAVNQGQLKALASHFYDRLIEAGYTHARPWEASTEPPDDYAAANIGQAKKLFSFNLREDTDADGLPDWWEQLIIDANPGDALAGLADVAPGDNFDHDDFSNEDEYDSGSSPVLPNGADSDVDGLVDTTEPYRGTEVGPKDHPLVQLQFNLAN